MTSVKIDRRPPNPPRPWRDARIEETIKATSCVVCGQYVHPAERQETSKAKKPVHKKCLDQFDTVEDFQNKYDIE